MGVLEPVSEVINEDIPATPPDLQDLQIENNVDSGDDLFVEVENKQNHKNTIFNFDNSIMPLIPTKMEDKGFLGFGMKNIKSFWGLQTPQQQEKKKKNLCSRCFDEMKKDLKKLALVVENFKNERDAAKAENEKLKKEVKELKKILKEKEDKEKDNVRLIIDNNNNKKVIDVNVKREIFKNGKNVIDNHLSQKNNLDTTNQFGVNSFSINLQEQEKVGDYNVLSSDLDFKPKSKKTIAELRREFFAEEFKIEQKSFTARNYLEIKPNEKKETERSRLTIKIEPRQKINEIISSLSSKLDSSKLIPEPAPINLFQRFEKTRDLWENGLKENCV